MSFKLNKDTLLDEYRAFLGSSNLSDKSKSSYYSGFALFYEYLNKNDFDINLLGPFGLIKGYLESLIDKNPDISMNTINAYRSSICYFYNEFVDVHVFVAKTDLKPIRRHEPVWASKDDVNKLLSFLDGQPQIIAMLAYHGGLKSNVIMNLRIKDITSNTDVLSGVVLPQHLMMKLREQAERARLLYCCELNEFEQGYCFNGSSDIDCSHLFYSNELKVDKENKVLSRRYGDHSSTSKSIKSAERLLKINPVSLSILRASHAVHQVQDGAPVPVVAKRLGVNWRAFLYRIKQDFA